MMKRYILILITIFVTGTLISCQEEKTPHLEIISIPESVDNGDDFEIIIKTEPFANCRIYMPIYAWAMDGSPTPVFDNYIQADANGIVQLSVPANENPFYRSTPPIEPPTMVESICTITSSHTKYPQEAEIEVNIFFPHWEPQQNYVIVELC